MLVRHVLSWHNGTLAEIIAIVEPQSWLTNSSVALFYPDSIKINKHKGLVRDFLRLTLQTEPPQLSQCTDWLIAKQNGGGAIEFPHPAGIEPKSTDSLRHTLTSEPWVHINSPEKNGIWLVVFHNLQMICLHTALLFSDCSSWISRPDTKFQNSWTQNLWLINLIAFNIDWSWKISLCTNFAQSSLSSSTTLKKWGLRTWKFQVLSRFQCLLIFHNVCCQRPNTNSKPIYLCLTRMQEQQLLADNFLQNQVLSSNTFIKHCLANMEL